MQKIRNMTQIGLVVVLTQIGLLILTRGTSNVVAFNVPSFLFIFGLTVGIGAYVLYFSKEMLDFKLDLKRTRYLLPILFCYFMMLMINAFGTYLMILDQSAVVLENQQLLVELFVNSSIFLMGFDMVALAPLAGKVLPRSAFVKRKEVFGLILGLLAFAFLHHPQGIGCFVTYLALGSILAKTFSEKTKRLEISILVHVLRNTLTSILLIIFL